MKQTRPTGCNSCVESSQIDYVFIEPPSSNDHWQALSEYGIGAGLATK